MDRIGSIFAGIGVVTSAGVLMLIGWWACDWIKEKIADARWAHKYKHRFDKPPLAQCYCRDCCNYNPKTGRCLYYTSLYVRDNMFCAKATPYKHDPELEKK